MVCREETRRHRVLQAFDSQSNLHIYLKLKQSKAVGCQHSFAALRACQAKGAASGEEVGSGTRCWSQAEELFGLEFQREGHVTYTRVVQPCRDKEMPEGPCFSSRRRMPLRDALRFCVRPPTVGVDASDPRRIIWTLEKASLTSWALRL